MFKFIKKAKKENINIEFSKYIQDRYIPKDNYKTKEYYLNKLNNINDYINKTKEKFERNEVVNKRAYYFVINKYILQKINILYVLNEEFIIIKEFIEEYINNLKEYAKESKLPYNNIVNALALSYLFDIEIEKIEFIKQSMLDEKYVDAILDILRKKIFENRVLNTKEFYFKENGYFEDQYDKSTGELINVIKLENIDERTNEFLKYLKEVKEKHYKRVLKYYEEKGTEKYTYTGSYDFKITAIAKILEIKKDRLIDSKFIASDLL